MAKSAEEKLAEAFLKFATDIRFNPRYFGNVVGNDHSIISNQVMSAFIGYIDAMASYWEKGIYNDNDRQAAKFAKEIKDMIETEYGWMPSWQ